MNINRKNYEEYFLLYADNELAAADRDMVEAFLATNPDLQEEMQMLQEAVLMPEPIMFEDKESLLKPQPIDAAIQQQLILLLDNELAGADKRNIESLIKNNEVIGKEWQLLQQTKLAAADKIIFANKDLLYKKEEGRVIPFGWRRVAAAALLIGFGIWGTVSYMNNKTGSVSPGSIVKSGDKKLTDKPANILTPQVMTADTDTQQEAIAADTKQDKNNNITITPVINNNAQDKIAPVKNKIDQQKNEIAAQDNNNDTPGGDLQNLNNPTRNKTDLANVPLHKKEIGNGKATIDPAEINNPPINEVAVNTTSADDNNAVYASFDMDEDDNKPRKTKIGGFFKKVKRVLERKANIGTGGGDNIKIANMSFAMH